MHLTKRAVDLAVRGAFWKRILSERLVPFRELVLTAKPLTHTVGWLESN